MSTQTVTSEFNASVLTLTLNRPDVLNSFNREMALSLQSHLKSAAHNSEVRAVLLTGAGRAFCAGQDLADVAPAADGSLPDLGGIVRECYNPMIQQIRTIEKPVICAVNGVAAGAGANLALACDIVVASAQASFIQSFSKVGLIPDSGGTFMLPRLIGWGRAAALTMLAEKVGAQDALQMGLIYKVVEADCLAKTTQELAQHLAQQPTRGLGLTKRAFNAACANSLEEQLALEATLQEEAGRTDDYREGVTSFVGKRKPTFRGL